MYWTYDALMMIYIMDWKGYTNGGKLKHAFKPVYFYWFLFFFA